jgi:hypothetical protein
LIRLFSRILEVFRLCYQEDAYNDTSVFVTMVRVWAVIVAKETDHCDHWIFYPLPFFPSRLMLANKKLKRNTILL